MNTEFLASMGRDDHLREAVRLVLLILDGEVTSSTDRAEVLARSGRHKAAYQTLEGMGLEAMA